MWNMSYALPFYSHEARNLPGHALMFEWSSYSLEDFLLFAPQTYYRLFELYNLAVWPLGHGLAALGGLGILALLLAHITWRERAIFALLAGAWTWVAWAYFLSRYASINWAANYYAYGFLLQSALLMLFAILGGKIASPLNGGWTARAGACLFIFALLLQPLIGPWQGRGWAEMEITGLAPDPTVAASLGLLLLMQGHAKWLLLPIPLLWCFISGTTLWAMDAPDALLMPGLALCVILMLSASWAWKIADPSAKV